MPCACSFVVGASVREEQEAARKLEQAIAHLYDLRAGAYNRLRERFREAKAQLATKEEELCWVQGVAVEVPGLRNQLAEAGLHRDLAIVERDQLRTEVDRLVAEKAKTEDAHQAELGRLAEERGKVAEELADASRRIAQLKKDLEAQARASALRENGMLGEAQHLDEAFSRVFPETQEAADAAVYAHRADQRALGADIDAYAAWSFSKLVLAGEARLQAVEGHMHRLFEAGLGMVSSLWLSAVVPDSVTQLARWLEAGVERLGARRASATRAGAEVALRFVVS